MNASRLQKRFYEYGFNVGSFLPGRNNTIADVAGVLVGHTTLNRQTETKTGVTIIDPGTKNLFHDKLPAALAVGNGFGKLVGATQIDELGTLETPIALTNTLAVGPAARGIVDLVLQTNIVPAQTTINAVVGETNDGFLNAIHKNTVTPKHVQSAYNNRRSDFSIGCVGAGTGTRSFAWKGGIGTASRVVSALGARYTIAVILQSNYGGSLHILGVPIGKLLGKPNDDVKATMPDGSCMIIVATDAPLLTHQLRRIAKRSLLGLVRTGSIMAHGSGDYAVAFTTSRNGIPGSKPSKTLPDDTLNAFFEASADAAEESVYDALFAAQTTRGRAGHVLEALPIHEVLKILQQKLL